MSSHALPQDPPTRQLSIHSVPESSGTSLTDSEVVSRGSRSRTRSRSTREAGIYGEITYGIRKLQAQLQDEKRRADDAERKLAQVTTHLKTVNDARLIAMQDAAQAKEDLRLYKIQLDAAQREIFRAQDIIGLVDQQRHVAETEAAKNRSKARELNETLMVQAAREEAFRLGLHEGLERGRNIALAESFNPPYGVIDPPPPLDDDYSSEESRSASTATGTQTPYHINTRSVASTVHSRAPTEFVVEESPNPASVNLPPVFSMPPSAPPTIHSASRPPSTFGAEPLRPVSIRNAAPSPRLPSAGLPIPDNLIPSLDSDNRIRIPPAFEFSRTPERASSPPLPTVSDSSVEPVPIPPPVQSSTSQRGRGHHSRKSSSASSSLSALDIINEPRGGAFRTPMSVIPEVLSQHSGSPHPWSIDGDHSMRHHHSPSTSLQQPPLSRMHSVNEFLTQTPSHQRPSSRTSFTGSYRNPLQHASDASSLPEIAVQPPSRPLSDKTDSLRGGPRSGGSPASQYRGASSVLNNMPGGLTDIPSSFTPIRLEQSPSQAAGHSHRSRRAGSSQLGSRRHDEDDAVSSALSADTLTTPPGKYQTVEAEEGVNVAEGSGSALGRAPSVTSRHGSATTAVYSAQDSAVTEDMTGVGSMNAKKTKKGKKKR